MTDSRPVADTRERLSAILAFLNGAAPHPDYEGHWFGDDPPAGKGRYFWRKDLREAVAAALSPPQQEPVAEIADLIDRLAKRADWHEASANDLRLNGSPPGSLALQDQVTDCYLLRAAAGRLRLALYDRAPPLGEPAAQQQERHGLKAIINLSCDYTNPEEYVRAVGNISRAALAAGEPSQSAELTRVLTMTECGDWFDATGQEWIEFNAEVQRRMRSAEPTSEPSAEPLEMFLCETERLILRAGQLYRFSVDADCARCNELAATYATERPAVLSTSEPCPRCGQTDTGQTGEYSCPRCGLPTVWDEAAKSRDQVEEEAEGAELCVCGHRRSRHCWGRFASECGSCDCFEFECQAVPDVSPRDYAKEIRDTLAGPDSQEREQLVNAIRQVEYLIDDVPREPEQP